MVQEDEVREALDVPETVTSVAKVCIGLPATPTNGERITPIVL